jgi:protein-S-isoprenylcysteine O-methyltransferase Ste14
MESVLAIASIAMVAAPVFFFALWRWFAWWRRRPLAAYAMIATVLGTAIAAAVTWRDELLANRVAMPAWLVGVGWIVIAIAGAFSVIADRQIGWHVRCFVPFFEDHGSIELVTDGAYAVVRHPLYAAGIWFQLGVFFVTGCVAVAIACAVFFAGATWFTRQEERRLVELLDDPGDYDRYRARVPALIPFLR